jgi:bifunctional UDP-N-acetylglucosamine pyrophosphorylase / glucosamine-1-phosphate N-acetyltransferase
MTGIVLAAGKSKRMGRPAPKVLMPLAGRPVLAYVIVACRAAGVNRILAVVGDRQEQVRQEFAGQPLEFAVQHEQRGTADAVLSCDGAIPAEEDVLVLSGDVPLVRVETLKRLIEQHRRQAADLTLLSATVADPHGYGRVIRNAAGEVQAIVEERDATPEQRVIREMNVGLYVFRWGRVAPVLREIRPSPVSGEYYFPEAVRLLVGRSGRVATVSTTDQAEFMGINTPEELLAVEVELARRSAGK